MLKKLVLSLAIALLATLGSTAFNDAMAKFDKAKYHGKGECPGLC